MEAFGVPLPKRSLTGFHPIAAFVGATESPPAFLHAVGEQSQRLIRQDEALAKILLYLHATLRLRLKLVEPA